MKKVVFIDDSKHHMKPLVWGWPEGNGGGSESLFVKLLENEMTPITLFFGNYENEEPTDPVMGQDEVDEYLDNFARTLSFEGFEFKFTAARECRYYKQIKDSSVEIDVNQAAALLYSDPTNDAAKNILQCWGTKIGNKLRYNQGKAENRYEPSLINDFLKHVNHIFQKVYPLTEEDIVLLDMVLVCRDEDRLSIKEAQPILSAVLYHYFTKELTVGAEKHVKCALYSTYIDRDSYKDHWIDAYNRLYSEDKLTENEKSKLIFSRSNLRVDTIKNIDKIDTSGEGESKAAAI